MAGLASRAGRVKWLARGLYVLGLVAVAPFLVWNSFTQQLNAALYDTLLRLRRPAHSSGVREVVLVAIDDETAARYGPLPLRRDRLAAGLDRLFSFEPKVLALDLLLSEPSDPAADAALAGALRKFPRASVAAGIRSDTGAAAKWIWPLKGLSECCRVAHVHAAQDGDGNVRTIALEQAAGGRRLWALAVEAAGLALGGQRPLEAAEHVELGSVRIPARADDRVLTINYAGPEGTFTRVSFASLLDGKVRSAVFHNKIVIVGVTAQGGGDRLFTPVSSGIGMSGVEIHANAVRTILDRAFLSPAGVVAEAIALLSIAAAAVLAIGTLRGVRLVLVLGAIALALPVFCVGSLEGGRIWPLGSLIAAFAVSAGVAGAGEYAAVTLELRRSEAKRQDYAFRLQAIAHEIKTPLTAIQGTSEMISGELVPERQRVEMAGLIHRESKRLTAIIQAFLDVERMAAGTLKLQKQDVDLRAVCEEVLERARFYAARKASRIEADVPELKIQADPELLSFAVYNLLTNAVKYSPKRSSILLAAREEDGHVLLSVTDQGYGIAPAEQKRIFERFYRLKRDEAGPESGSGLGLALVKEITVQHGGRVLVESKPGAGSRFTLALPKGDA